jgi:hypothetical protein
MIDTTILIKYYLILLLLFFIYMFNFNKKWYGNKFVFYASTVYLPILLFIQNFIWF